jgi:DNA invertase Pin-like site-specific DNA recombinase
VALRLLAEVDISFLAELLVAAPGVDHGDGSDDGVFRLVVAPRFGGAVTCRAIHGSDLPKSRHRSLGAQFSRNIVSIGFTFTFQDGILSRSRNYRDNERTTMTVIGYARVSTTDQDLAIQQAALRAAGCDLIRAEKQSGTSKEGRAELRTVLDFIAKGDVLLVTRVDRLARSIGDLQDIVRTLKAKGASVRATEQPVDTSTAAGKCFLDMLGVFAEFETNLRRERQLEGIAKAKAEGVYKGRKRSIDQAQVEKLKAEGLGATEIAKRLNIGRASVYRVLAAG